MADTITIAAFTAADFAPYGDVLDASGDARIINQGLCQRFHDRALMDYDDEGQLGVSVFNAVPRDLPYRLELVERHPLGNQCFMPMTEQPFLVIVCDDKDGIPQRPKAFIVPTHTGINIHRNVWHGVLTPLKAPADMSDGVLFAVIDRIGDDGNLEEYNFPSPYTITAS